MENFDYESLNKSDEEKLQKEELLKTKLASYTMTYKTREETYKLRKERAEKRGQTFPSSDDTKAIKIITSMLTDLEDEIRHMGGTTEQIEEARAKAQEKPSTIDRKALLEKVSRVKASEKATDEDEKSEDDFEIKLIDENEVLNQSEKEESMPKDFDLVYEPLRKSKMEKEEIEEPSIPTPKFSETVRQEENKPQMETKTRKLFDSIPLPSKGECYVSKEEKIPVAYLTAYDENLIVSPNLYDDGTFIDVLLKNKIMYKDFNPDDLLPGDRDAIVLWLRASGYGNEFPVTATDKATGEQFNTTVDLSKINYKPFTLKGDKNGYFDFTLPISKDKIKFRFLTYGLLKKLQEMNDADDLDIKKGQVEKMTDTLEEFIEEDKRLNEETRKKLDEAVNRLRKYGESIPSKKNDVIHAITNKLQLSIVSINGNTDKTFIEEYIKTMFARDSYALRTYITNNEPGVDFNVEVERPERLGGGSVSMFLTLDQFLFFSIVE